MIADPDAADALANPNNNTRPFMTRHNRQSVFCSSRHEMPITVTDSGGNHADENFTLARHLQIERFYCEGDAGLGQNGRINFHPK